MKSTDIIRAWKDQQFYSSLTDEQRAALPANPAGELSELDSEQVAGGGHTSWHVCGPMTISLTGGSGCDECDEK